jgi:hypothetical protein
VSVPIYSMCVLMSSFITVNRLENQLSFEKGRNWCLSAGETLARVCADVSIDLRALTFSVCVYVKPVGIVVNKMERSTIL